MKLDGLIGKVAIVTGAGRGIGRAIALELARNGSTVAVVDVDEESARLVAGEIEALSYKSVAVKCDVSNISHVKLMIEICLSKFGTIDILINNAGIFQVKQAEEITEKEWDLMFNINLKGAFLCSQAVIPIMKSKRWGKIVNVGSSAGKTGAAQPCAHYAASKAGIMCLTKSLARELAPFNINVNAVAPALIETDMIRDIADKVIYVPIGRLGKPEDVANVVAFLCSENANFLTGEVIDVNGGFLID